MKALLQPRGVRKILLVTNSLHMGRARGVFERAGFEVLVAVADNISNTADSPESRLSLMYRASKEFLARIYYRIAGYL